MLKILVIEDDPKIRDIIVTYLKRYDYDFTEAVDGRAGIDAFESANYDAVILDVMMPQMDGWTVLRTIREQSDIPVLLLTAREQERDKLFGFDLGADDYLTKPFSPKELLARLKVILRRSGAKVATPIMAFGTLLIDTEARQVSRDGIAIKLTPKEYDLLAFLAQNPRRALSRQQLLDSVWGMDFFGDDRTVDTHIKLLRENLGPYKHWIATVWGVGYRFEPEVGDQ